MPLLGNYSVLLKSPGRFRSGSSISDTRASFNNAGSSRAMYAGEAGFSKQSGVPNGYGVGTGAWVPPLGAGGMSSYNQAVAALTGGAANLAQGVALAAAVTVTMTGGNGVLDLILSIVGAGTITLTATGVMVGAVDLTGVGPITFSASVADLDILAGLVAAGTLTMTGTGALTGIAELSGDVLPYTELSPESLAAAVWAYILDGSFTAADLARLQAAALAGKVSGAAGSTITIRNPSDTKDRIVATVDGDGNRTDVTFDLSD